ncbi:MAG TPA: tRNA (adenosine(37)-N6)-threonylcarbamoyltransferase complex ATPase subunit type 1 TsaE, partial [Tepidisphaeraceae bacterium]
YRIHGADDFEQIGFEELLDQGGVVVVEWASRVLELLPIDTIHVSIANLSPTERLIEITMPPAAGISDSSP